MSQKFYSNKPKTLLQIIYSLNQYLRFIQKHLNHNHKQLIFEKKKNFKMLISFKFGNCLNTFLMSYIIQF